MIKSVARLEHKIGDRIYHMICDNDSPIAEVKEALFKFMGHVSQVEDAAEKQAECSKACEAEPKPEAQ